MTLKTDLKKCAVEQAKLKEKMAAVNAKAIFWEAQFNKAMQEKKIYKFLSIAGWFFVGILWLK